MNDVLGLTFFLLSALSSASLIPSSLQNYFLKRGSTWKVSKVVKKLLYVFGKFFLLTSGLKRYKFNFTRPKKDELEINIFCNRFFSTLSP